MNYYLHIPFCREKCPYCKFALTPIFDAAKKRRYLAYMENELKEYFLSSLRSEDLSLKNSRKNLQEQTPPTSSVGSPPSQGGIGTVYFGGGTPSILTLEEVQSILDCFPFLQHSKTPRFQSSTNEVSFECNPEDITEEYVTGLINLGINRLSIGVQSLNNDTLKSIHRSDRASIFRALQSLSSVIARNHSDSVNDDVAIQVPEKQSTRSLHSSRGHKFYISLNVDFILGLPYSKPGEILKNIKELHERYPYITHTSVYMLEDGHYPKDWKKHSISESEMQKEYSEICEYFASLGWHHYEISNWAKPGYECRHNLGYWNHSHYRGFGLSATSYEDGHRFTNSSSFHGYYKKEIEYDERLSEDEIDLEKIIYAMRTFSLDRKDFGEEILGNLETKGWIEKENTKILLTPSGIFRENTILSSLISNTPP